MSEDQRTSFQSKDHTGACIGQNNTNKTFRLSDFNIDESK